MIQKKRRGVVIPNPPNILIRPPQPFLNHFTSWTKDNLMSARQYTHKAMRKEKQGDQEIDVFDFSITVREQLGRDVGTSRYVQIVLREHLKKEMGVSKLPDIAWETIIPVTNIVTQTMSTDGNLPFRVPSSSDPEQDIITFYECLMDLPGRYMRAFEAALEKVNAEPDPNPSGALTAPQSTHESEPESVLAM